MVFLAHAGPEIQVGVWERRRFWRSCQISTCFWALSGHLRSAAGCKAENGGLGKRLRDMLVLNMCISCHLGAACFIQLATTAPRQPLSDCSTSATLVVTRAHFSSRTRAHTTWWPTDASHVGGRMSWDGACRWQEPPVVLRECLHVCDGAEIQLKQDER